MLDYVTHGDSSNPALLLMHAGGLTYEEWTPFVEAWQPHFYLIMPSALAHGGSENVPELSISAMADATLALLDELGVEQAHMMGSSMGGAIAFWIALTAPDRVGKLVIYRTSYRSSPAVHKETVRMAHSETWRAWRLDTWLSEQHEPPGGPDAWQRVTEKVAAAFDPATTDHLHDLTELSTIESPTLIIAGDRDPVVPLGDAVEMYQTIPDASLWIVPHATHFMGMEGWRRPTFEQEILRFLRRA